MSFNAFVNEFTEAPLQTSYSSYLGLDYTSVQGFQLEWTFQNQNTPYPFSTVITTTNNASGNTLTLPNAEVTSVGTSTTIINQGAFSLNVLNFLGTSVAPSVLPGQQWQLVLTDNSTPGGSWLALQLGVGSTSVSAPSLIDNDTDENDHGLQSGLLALPDPGSQQFLGMNITVNKINHGESTYTQYAGDRGSVLVWLSGQGTYTCQAASEYLNGYNFIVVNQGSGILTIAPSPVTGNTINGLTTPFTLNPGQSSLFVSDGVQTIYSYGTSALTSNRTTILTVDLDNATGSPLSLLLTQVQAQATILEFQNGTGATVTVNYPQLLGTYIAYNESDDTSIILQIVGNSPGSGFSYLLLPGNTITLFSDGTNTEMYMSPTMLYNASIDLQSGSLSLPSLRFGNQPTSGFYLNLIDPYENLPTIVQGGSPCMSFTNVTGTTTCFSDFNTVNANSYFDNGISIYTIMRAYG